MSGGSHKHSVKKFFHKFPKLFRSSSHGHEQPEAPRTGKSQMLGYIDYYGNLRQTERPEHTEPTGPWVGTQNNSPPVAPPPGYGGNLNAGVRQPVNTAPPMAQLPTFGIDPFAVPENGHRRSGHQTFTKPEAFTMRPGSYMSFGKANRYAMAIPEWDRVRRNARDVAFKGMDPDMELGSVTKSRSAMLMQTGTSYRDIAENQSVIKLANASEKAGGQDTMSMEDYTDLKTLVAPYAKRLMDIDLADMLQMDDETLMENAAELNELRQTSMYISDLMKNTVLPSGGYDMMHMAGSSGYIGGQLSQLGSPNAGGGLSNLKKMTLRRDLLPTQEDMENFDAHSVIMSNLALKARGLLLSELQRRTEQAAPGSGPNLHPAYFREGEIRNGADRNTNEFIDSLLKKSNIGNQTMLKSMRAPGSRYNIRGNVR